MKLKLKALYMFIKNRKKCSNLFHCVVSHNSCFEGENYIGSNSLFNGILGYGSYIGTGSEIRGKIGRFSCIGDRVHVICGKHPTHDFISIHPAFYSIDHPNCRSFVSRKKYDEYSFADAENKYEVIVGNDVWIASDVIIRSGVTIGDGAIIAAGAIVIDDVPPYSIVAGIPASIKRYRFDKEIIDKLIEFKWWDYPIDWVRRNADMFENPQLFMSLMGKEND